MSQDNQYLKTENPILISFKIENKFVTLIIYSSLLLQVEFCLFIYL